MAFPAPNSMAVPEAWASKANPQMTIMSKPCPRRASRAASLTQPAVTVPYCGPTLTATRCGVPFPPPRRSPTNWISL